MRTIKILIVEDNEDCAFLLRELFKKSFPQQLYIEQTDSARLALHKLENTFFDVVVSDMCLVDLWIGGNCVIEKASEKGSLTVLYSAAAKEYTGVKPNFIFLKPFNSIVYNSMIAIIKNRLKLNVRPYLPLEISLIPISIELPN
jgi:DNA-binding NarL/FixJ family response regulator